MAPVHYNHYRHQSVVRGDQGQDASHGLTRNFASQNDTADDKLWPNMLLGRPASIEKEFRRA
ncbi:MAG: hypothetical protein NPIRA03_20590 [Nitrospirales bacterium]|nr:MAG: hypothetical protein NPIRA03_20590 [Nitrospirales bacterium]